jgi:hypothetical protein
LEVTHVTSPVILETLYMIFLASVSKLSLHDLGEVIVDRPAPTLSRVIEHNLWTRSRLGNIDPITPVISDTYNFL